MKVISTPELSKQIAKELEIKENKSISQLLKENKDESDTERNGDDPSSSEETST